MKLGCGSVLFRKFDLERGLDAIRNIGYKYFEVQAVGPWCPHVDVYKDDPEFIVTLKKKYGFEGITGLWTLDGNIISNEKAVESNIRSIEWAAAAGIPIVFSGDGHKPKDMDTDTAYKVLEEKMLKILEAAAKNGVKLAIEPHGTFSLTGEGLGKMMSFGSPDVLGINYDACNVFRAGYVESGNNQSGYKTLGNGEDELSVLKAVSDRVVHCHAKDMDQNKVCVSVGAGLVNVKGCVEHLKEIGYDGVISVETEGGDDFDAIVKLASESYQYLDRLMKGE